MACIIYEITLELYVETALFTILKGKWHHIHYLTRTVTYTHNTDQLSKFHSKIRKTPRNSKHFHKIIFGDQMSVYVKTLYTARMITDAVLNRLSGEIPSVTKFEGFIHPAVFEPK